MKELELHVQEAIERLKRREEAIDTEMTVHLDECLLRMARQFKAVSPEEVEKWEWENSTVRDMLALGWDRRHCRKISPDWNCSGQEHAFGVMSKTLVGNGAIVALVGERGVGKTTNASEHTRLRVEQRRDFYRVPAGQREKPHAPLGPGRYEKLGRLSNIFKPLYADFGSINSDQLAAQLQRWCNLDLVVVDELHETEDLKTNMRFLVDFVDRRYANKKDTILISNHSAEEFKREVNSSIISRITHHGRIIECAWGSHRNQA
jgi:hypothetical protein